MEHLELHLEEVEESYDKLFRKTVEVANYAEEAFEYDSSFETTDLLLENFGQEEIESRFEEALEEVDEIRENFQNSIYQLAREIQRYSEGRISLPERHQEIDSKLGDFRDLYKELNQEVNNIAEEAGETRLIEEDENILNPRISSTTSETTEKEGEEV